MAQFDRRNLALTIYAVHRRRLPCEVGHTNDGRGWVWRHRWTEGRCRNCHKTLKETLEPPCPVRGSHGAEATRWTWAALGHVFG